MSNGKPWFVSNANGPGFHPATWQGWLILIAAVAAIVCVVLVIKGVL